ncbi:caspase family protein [Streptomyces sp. NPDC059165]|uniref:caspase, EACC1-associated type n=1 Tax=Streptomyces sp. NPDC059165 TaxID=3346751 RepID=UPI0036A1AC18
MIRLPDPAQSRAFLFGTSAYRAVELDDLPAVANNLQDLWAALTSPRGGFAPERCTVLSDPDSLHHVFDALQHHAHEATDTLLVYFAGHGIPGLTRDLYLTLPNTQEHNVPATGFHYEWLHDIVRQSGAANKIVILDCCFSGRAIPGMGAGAAALVARLEIEGACVLASSSRNKESLAPAGAPHTSFTGQLLHLLNHGVPGDEELLSLGMIAEQLDCATRGLGLPTPKYMFQGTTQHIALARNSATAVGRAARTEDALSPLSASSGPITAEDTHVARPLDFARTLHATRKELASTVRAHWALAANRFFQHMGTTEHPSESWSELRSWMKQFNNPRTDEVEARNVLIDRYLTDPSLPADHKLLHLLRWLDPDGSVVYLGAPITYATLTRACLAGYVGGGEPEVQLLAELSDGCLFDTLAEFSTLARLQGVWAQWNEALTAWRTVADSDSLPSEVRDWAAATGPGALLAALLPPECLAEVRDWLPVEGQAPDLTVAWYTGLLKAVGGRETLLGRLVESEWSERARQEAVAEASEREQRRATELKNQEDRRRFEERQRERELREAREEEQRRLQELEWRAAEAARLHPAARTLAMRRVLMLAVGWVLPVIVAVWLIWWFTRYEFAIALLLTGLAAVVSGSALWQLAPCAYRLGGAFRPRLREPWFWLPPIRAIFTTGVPLLTLGLISINSASQPGSTEADSDLLVALLLLPAFAACVWAGVDLGRTMAGRWEQMKPMKPQFAIPLAPQFRDSP